MHTQQREYICIYMYTCIYMYIHIYIYVHTCVCVYVLPPNKQQYGAFGDKSEESTYPHITTSTHT